MRGGNDWPHGSLEIPMKDDGVCNRDPVGWRSPSCTTPFLMFHKFQSTTSKIAKVSMGQSRGCFFKPCKRHCSETVGDCVRHDGHVKSFLG
ncbi:hypothetical protein V6N12_060994 [Hibiscus sabdariffa]|uniref:Uncharacterized protein n=1 Tax=Hibiscus sabdariffa TaxID=183260 RepID=A0ABR2DVR0_9ROSI